MCAARLGALHLGVLVSMGVALGPSRTPHPTLANSSAPALERLLAEADAALYAAKVAGRDRVLMGRDPSQAIRATTDV